MAKKYTPEDYARAVLRAGISTCNQQLNDIFNNHLKGASIIDDGHGSFVVSSDFIGTANYNPFHQAHKYLNNEFFFSEKNDFADSIIGQAYYALASKRPILTLLKEEERSTDTRVHMDPLFKGILLRHDYECQKLSKEYMQKVYNGKMTLQQAKEELKAKTPVLSGDTYEGMLVRGGFKDRPLQQAKYFIDIMKYQDTDARISDFLDIYSLYHYYIFRKSINHKFFKYLKENPSHNLYKRQYEFEKILKEEIHKHCHLYPCKENAFLRRDMLSLNPRRMSVDKAKRLTLQMHEAPSHIRSMLAQNISYEINKSTNGTTKLVIKDIIIEPQTKINGTTILKNPSRVVKRKETASGRIYTNVKTTFADSEVKETSNMSRNELLVEREKNGVPFVPNNTYYKPRVVEKSKLPRLLLESTIKKRELKAKKEKERQEKEERSKKLTQLTIFDDTPLK